MNKTMNKNELIAIIKKVKEMIDNDFFEDGSFEYYWEVNDLLDYALGTSKITTDKFNEIMSKKIKNMNY